MSITYAMRKVSAAITFGGNQTPPDIGSWSVWRLVLPSRLPSLISRNQEKRDLPSGPASPWQRSRLVLTRCRQDRAFAVHTERGLQPSCFPIPKPNHMLCYSLPMSGSTRFGFGGTDSATSLPVPASEQYPLSMFSCKYRPFVGDIISDSYLLSM